MALSTATSTATATRTTRTATATATRTTATTTARRRKKNPRRMVACGSGCAILRSAARRARTVPAAAATTAAAAAATTTRVRLPPPLLFITMAAMATILLLLRQQQHVLLPVAEGFPILPSSSRSSSRRSRGSRTAIPGVLVQRPPPPQRRRLLPTLPLSSSPAATTPTTPTAPTRLTMSSSSSSSSSSNYITSTIRREELVPGIEAIRRANPSLWSMLEQVRDKPYFRLYSVDILASCEYLPQELFECYTESCEIYPVDEDEVPDRIKSVDMEEHDFELDGWARWDMPSEDYYDTRVFPEAYTGYDGAEVWRFIHDRICFDGYEYDDDHWKADFNKAVSGLHSVVSAQIIIGIIERIEAGEPFADSERWRDPVAEFERRLGPNGETPLAIENLYFLYMLLLTAASRARERLLRDCDAGRIVEAAPILKEVLKSPILDNPAVEVASRKLHDHAVKDADSVGALWEARMRSRELLRIMNCVQCNKCRLHGKICMMGFSTALQVLVGRTGEGGDTARVHRVELAALMTTLHKCARAVKLCEEMNASP